MPSLQMCCLWLYCAAHSTVLVVFSSSTKHTYRNLFWAKLKLPPRYSSPGNAATPKSQ
jgi:hypothetical protein